MSAISTTLKNLFCCFKQTPEENQEVQIYSENQEEHLSEDVWTIAYETFKKLNCPFESKLNPHIIEVQKATDQWASKWSIPSSEKYRFAQLMGYAHPHCSQEHLIIFTCWVTMLFHYDDLVEKELFKDPEKLKLFNDRNLQILKGDKIEDKDHYLTKAIHDLRNSLLSISDEEWMKRFMDDLSKHFEGIVWESTKKGIPDFDTYLEKRNYTSAVFLMFDFCEIAEDVRLSEKVFNNVSFKNLRALGNQAVWAPNDIVSFPKEPQENGNNMIHILMHEKNCGLKKAVEQTKQFCEEVFDALQNLSEKMKKEVSEKEFKYVLGVLFWVKANYEWSLETYRYKKPKEILQPDWKKV